MLNGDKIRDGSDGGGGRIRTFEVDDGRFTVCSLSPLGNPTPRLILYAAPLPFREGVYADNYIFRLLR